MGHVSNRAVAPQSPAEWLNGIRSATEQMKEDARRAITQEYLHGGYVGKLGVLEIREILDMMGLLPHREFSDETSPLIVSCPSCASAKGIRCRTLHRNPTTMPNRVHKSRTDAHREYTRLRNLTAS